MNNRALLVPVAEEFANQRNLKDVHHVGSGTFKETYRVTTSTGDYMALKLFNPDKCNILRSEREVDALCRCDTPLIGKLWSHGSFAHSSGKSYYYTLEEYLDGGSLTDQIRNNLMTPQLVRDYAVVLVRAIDYLKSVALVHRDIKPDNIMFRIGYPVPVLIDLGIARHLLRSSLTPSSIPHGPGTPYYSAPEQLNNEKDLIDWRTDQFSLGVVLGICLTNQHPFRESNMNEADTVQAMAQRKPCTSDFGDSVNAMGFGGIIKMVKPWPHQRYQATDELINYFRTVV